MYDYQAFNAALTAYLFGDLAMHEFAELKPKLAHYTSIGTLEKILQNNEVWFSHPLLMNDYEELRSGLIAAEQAFYANEKIKESCSPEFYQDLLQCFESALLKLSQEAHGIYIFCMTEHKDDQSENNGLLSMWRGYGADGNGVAFVIDSGKFEPVQYSPMLLSKVDYKTTEERRRWVDRKFDEFAALLKEYAPPKEILNDIASALIQRLMIFSLFTKNKGFEEENEWRFAYIQAWDEENHYYTDMLSYHVTAEGIEPKLKVKLGVQPVTGNDLSIEKIVTRIILGPCVSSELSHRAVSRLLTENKRADLISRVVRSSTPYRRTLNRK